MPIDIQNQNIIQTTGQLIDLRSSDVQEFISDKPNFFIRWGTTLMFMILIFIATASWFIQYPDIVISKARLTSTNAPKEVIARTDGKLIELFAQNGQPVKAGTKLGYLESVANPYSVAEIKLLLDSMAVLFAQNNIDKIISFYPNYSKNLSLLGLGELQQPFQTFMQSFMSFQEVVGNGFSIKKRSMLQTDLINLKKLLEVLHEQKLLQEKDLELSKKTFQSQESLIKDKVISVLDYRNEESKLIAKKLTLPQIKTAILNNENQQNEKLKEVAQLDNDILVQRNMFIQALQSIKSQFEQWEMKYTLKASSDGIVQLAGFYQKNQYIKSGQLIFYIQPDSMQYFAELFIPQYNFGKVAVGQDVLLKFQAYPYEQFGAVLSKIVYISSTPTDSGYSAKLILSNGLKTNYGKNLQYQYGLIAQADIVTESMRLLDRFMYNIRKHIVR